MKTINKQTINIDLFQSTMIPLPQFIQGDSNIIEFVVKDNGVDADLSNIGRVVVNYKRPDRKIISRLLTGTGNVMTYNIGIEEMEVPGYGEIEMNFFNADNTERISSKRFKVFLSESIGSDEYYENEGGLTLIQELLKQGDYAKEQGDYVASKRADIDRFTSEQYNLQSQLNLFTRMNSFNTSLSFTNGELSKVEEIDGASVKKRTTITYNSDGTINTVTDEIKGKTVISTMNYINGELASIDRQLIEGGL